MATAVSRRQPRFRPAPPSWQRLTVLGCLLLLLWATLVPVGAPTLWWHYLIGGALILAFLGSWHGQHGSTALRRWAPLTVFNRRQRSRTAQPRRPRGTEDVAPPTPAHTSSLEARIVIHLRPHPHALTTPTDADADDQLPWRFVTSWLNRYGVRADAQTITSATRMPPPSGLRTDSAALLTNRTPQHRDTWLTYTLRADQNVGVLTAHRTTVGTTANATTDTAAAPKRVALSDTFARRLIAELREQGWLATLIDDDQPLPRFVPDTATVRRERWTSSEYSDGFRALYAVEPGALADVLQALPTLAAKALWVSVTIASQDNQPTSVAACVGTVTSAQPTRIPLPGLVGFHGLHRVVAPTLTATGLAHDDLPSATVALDDLAALRWPTSAPGVPIGYDRARQPVYLGLSSPEPVRVTVTGTHDFHVGVVARLALSGLPVALYVADPRATWPKLANHAAPQQFSVRPAAPPTGAIIVTDGTGDVPAGAMSVTLRRPQASKAPATTIVITQDGRHPSVFEITTPQATTLLSSRLVDPGARR